MFCKLSERPLCQYSELLVINIILVIIELLINKQIKSNNEKNIAITFEGIFQRKHYK